jgi:methionyl-tRNA formyltransferase
MMTGDSEHKYIVASLHDWNEAAFNRHVRQLPGRWEYVSSRETLESVLAGTDRPRYVFFPHWSYKVPGAVVEQFECIAFHMTDVPYGRGGSPLQNLIVRGHSETKLTALRMTSEFDAGPVYLKKPLRLDGSALEIYQRAASLTAVMIEEIISSDIEPTEQVGEPTVFARRSPAESEIPEDLEPEGVYDFIRMLDAPGYPKAFSRYGKLRLEFYDAELQDGRVAAKVTIKEREESE